MLVGYDHQCKEIRAMGVCQQGPTPCSAQWLTDKIDQSGGRGVKVVMQSDQDKSTIVLKKAVTIERLAGAVLIESPVRD